MSINLLRKDILSLADPVRAKISQRFFKTGKGEYGEGDVFLGLSNPQMRQIAKKYKNLPFTNLQQLLRSEFHEERQISLFILILQFEKADIEKREEIYKFYLNNTTRINNWDLVDLSAYKIVGNYLYDKEKEILYSLAKSKDLWERRISIISTYYFIKNNRFEDTLKISEILLGDKQDLMHKAVGWMLREVGNKNRKTEEEFLKRHFKKMPRTMLRYAIEKFPENLRQKYLKGEI